MSPGGHAATTAVASAATAFLSGSLPLAAAVALGGFFIDVDHAVDYWLFNRQRDLRPTAFLRYYLEGRAERVVLALHSWELFALLAAIGWWTGWPLLWAISAAVPQPRSAGKVLVCLFQGRIIR
jgi:hypothetical protein